ncbi:hypothetical protein M0805_004853, partial [Coniferiporia weirii]
MWRAHQDSFMNLAKQGYAAYESSQENVSKTGGSEYNRPSHSQHDSGNGGVPHVDEDYAVNHATQHSSADSSLFSSAMGFLNANPAAKHEPIDEDHVTDSHQQAYHGEGPSSNMSADSLGSAAAMQAFKLFTSGQSQRSGGGGNDSSHLVSLAMSEASKLFDKAGGSSSGGKQEVINSAAMMVMKMLVQSKV